MDFETSIEKPKLIELLDELKAALSSGDSVSIQVGDKQINIPSDLRCEVEYEEVEGEAELEIELKWKTGGQALAVSSGPAGKYEIFQGNNEQWYFHLKSANNQIILVSQGYASKDNAKKGIASIKSNATTGNFELRVSQSHQPYFVLKAKNGEIIGTSQMYKRKIGAEKGIASVVHHSGAKTIER